MPWTINPGSSSGDRRPYEKAGVREEGIHMEKRNTPIGVAFSVFQLHNRSEMKSDDTIRWYDYAILQMLKAIMGLPVSTPMGEITEERLREYCASLRDRRFMGRPLASSTINGHIRSIRSFFSWAYRNLYTSTHLLKDFSPPKVTEQTIDVLSEDEVILLLESASRTKRDVAIVSLMVDTGLRASEVTGAVISELDIDRGLVSVLGKGRKHRTVAFGRSSGKYILSYMLHERDNDSLSERIFLTSTGKEMNRGVLYQMFRRLKRTSGITRVHPHLLRHTYATTFLMNGGNAFMLKEALGHTTMDMVLAYVHLAGAQVAEATRAFSPIDRLSARDRRKVAEGPAVRVAASTPGELFVQKLSLTGRRY